ncbi:MAG TPA: outer membrane beta-barrel protein [Chthoniobacter sp.]|nr:outer membrane beta-barrel protein [Chthoniobacter sp.]
MSVGYDDNVFQTPTHGGSVPTQKVQVLETAGSPAGSVQVLVPSGDPNIPDSVQTVQVPAVAPKFRTVTIPGVPEAQRTASWITRTDAKWDVQFANRRTLFTFDLGGGLDYYWNRPGKKQDYTGNVSLVYLRKLTGRLQFTAEADASYQSQPDFSQPNQPTSGNLGSYLSANAKADVSYRLTPRFSTVTSVSYNSVLYQDAGPNVDNYASTTFGTELRYLFSPRLTLLGELRYSSDAHDNSAALDTASYYALIGGELSLSRRFTASLRLGESVQKFSSSGDSDSTPYVEATLNYRIAQQTILSWNGRYGYEEAGTPNTRTIVARSGLQLTQIFTPRFQGVLSVNFLRNTSTTTSDVADTVSEGSADGSTATAAASTHSVTTESVQDTLDTSLGFYYTLDRHWSLNLTYSYTMVSGPATTFDYYRQRLFLGASYQF